MVHTIQGKGYIRRGECDYVPVVQKDNATNGRRDDASKKISSKIYLKVIIRCT